LVAVLVEEGVVYWEKGQTARGPREHQASPISPAVAVVQVAPRERLAALITMAQMEALRAAAPGVVGLRFLLEVDMVECGLFIPAQHAPSRQLKQEICDAILH
jgi:hypothetical protein